MVVFLYSAILVHLNRLQITVISIPLSISKIFFPSYKIGNPFFIYVATYSLNAYSILASVCLPRTYHWK